MENLNNTFLCKCVNRINLTLLIFGRATSDAHWRGKIVSPVFSRLYYIISGSFSITGSDGTRQILQPGKWYLLPSGYSFDYECGEPMDHLYFHVKLCDYDETDLL